MLQELKPATPITPNMLHLEVMKRSGDLENSLLTWTLALVNCNVRELSVDIADVSMEVKVLSEAPGLLDSHPHMSLNVQHLKLKTCLSRNCLHSITYLLRNSPLVQSLCIVLKRKAFGSESDREDWDAESSPSCELQNLKLVDIQCIQGQENELNFLKFLLKNGVVLEKVVLSSSASKEGKLVEINEKLVTFPRASLGVQVLPTNLSR
ncbi:hypothetical protein C5167_011191 [Papaver somniferum]|uniref:FBD domain-containing protein n=1 Tax=Papaver somniferum TaxID=3469 RepID=A0A4Y7K678_PAPSO|nr:hypothetical protein C5167_011191 [Papaver somniferum]